MDLRIRNGLLILSLGALGCGDRLGGQQPDALPAGVTPATITQGKKLFSGDGLCFSCHGPEANGLVGPDLTDDIWLIGKGTLDEIITRILEGVPPDKSKSGVVMPPRGGSRLKG
jgi:mono/diheme cytochrome c family protein